MIKAYFLEILVILKNYIKQVKDGELTLVAGSLAYATILGLVPFLAVSLSAFQWLGGPENFYPKIENLILSYFKMAVGTEVIRVIKFSIRNIHAGTLGSTGAAFLFITSMRLLHLMESAVHRVWNITAKRRLYKRILFYWLLIFLIPTTLAFYIALSSTVEVKGFISIFPGYINNGIVVFLVLFLINKFVPSRHVDSFFAMVASAIGAIGLITLQATYSLITSKILSYGKIYGGFAAVPLFLIWILYVWYVILGGVAICATLQKNRETSF